MGGGEFIVPIPRPLVIDKDNYERFAEGRECRLSGRAGRSSQRFAPHVLGLREVSLIVQYPGRRT